MMNNRNNIHGPVRGTKSPTGHNEFDVPPEFRSMNTIDTASPSHLEPRHWIPNKPNYMPSSTNAEIHNTSQTSKQKGSALAKTVQHGESDSAVGWKENPTVPKMTFFYPISPTHRRFPKTDVVAVLQRLTELFRFLSLETTFHDFPVLAATCRSLDQMELEVNFFECDKDSSQVVLEISRISGDTITFWNYAREILTVSFRDGNDDDSKKQLIDQNVRAQTFLRRLPLPEPERETTQESLELALDMLLSDRYDVRYLGLESLASLTDPTKTIRSVAAAFARAVLLGKIQSADGTTRTDSGIQERILFLALGGAWPDTPFGQNDQHKTHSHLALMIVANAISLLQDTKEFFMLLQDASRLTAGTCLVRAMQELVWNAPTEPHMAYLATRILALINCGHPDAVRGCVQPNAVLAAYHVGRSSHAKLEMESHRLLHALQAARS